MDVSALLTVFSPRLDSNMLIDVQQNQPCAVNFSITVLEQIYILSDIICASMLAVL